MEFATVVRICSHLQRKRARPLPAVVAQTKGIIPHNKGNADTARFPSKMARLFALIPFESCRGVFLAPNGVGESTVRPRDRTERPRRRTRPAGRDFALLCTWESAPQRGPVGRTADLRPAGRSADCSSGNIRTARLARAETLAA